MNMLPTPTLARNVDPNRPDANLALLSTPADLADIIGAAGELAWAENLGPKLARLISRTFDSGPHLTPDELNERFPRPDGTPWGTSMPERSARALWEVETLRYRTNRTLARGPGGALQAAAEFGTGIAVSFADPVNLAAGLLPFVGQARMAQLIARHGITRGRLITGAIDGSLGNLAFESLNAPLSLEEGQDYGAAQVIHNLTAGALFGATFHVTGGKIMDFMGRGRHTDMLAKAAAAVDTGRLAPVHELLALDPDIARAELYAGRTLNERERVVALENRAAFLGKVSETDVNQEVARRTARFISQRENPPVPNPATLPDPTRPADAPTPTRATHVTFDDAADDATFADSLAADADRMAKEDGIESGSPLPDGPNSQIGALEGTNETRTSDSGGSRPRNESRGIDDLQQLASKLAAKVEMVDQDAFRKRSGNASSPAFFDPATSSIVLRSDLFEALPPAARRKVLEEEVIHLATAQAYRAKHAASGSSLSFEDYYLQELHAIWDNVASTPEGRELVTNTISAYYGRKLEAPLNSLDEVLALTGGNPIPLIPELIRAGIQLRKDGVLTEASYQDFLGKIVQFLNAAISRMRELLDAEPSPLLADAIKRTEAVIEAARTGDPAKLPTQMVLRLDGNGLNQGAPPIAPAINDSSVPLHQRLHFLLVLPQGQKIREAQTRYRTLKESPDATPQERLEAAAEYRQAVTQHRALKSAIRQIEAAPDPATALDALIDGRNNLFSGARLGIAQLKNARFHQTAGALDAKLRQLGLTKAFANGDLDDPLAEALFQLTTPGGKTNHLPTPIVDLAQHITALQNRLTGQANALGATIGHLPGRIAQQAHNPDKLRRAGLAAWKEQIIPLLDARTFAKIEDIDAFLTQVYHNLVSGLHLQDLGAQTAIPNRSTSNIANSIGAHRKLHFKDAASWLAYQRAFGEPNLATSILADFKNLSAAAAAIEKLGPNPTHTFQLLTTNIEAALQTEPDKFQAFKAKRKNLEKFLDYQLGKLSSPTHPTLARISAGIRAWQTMARLGGVVLTSITDVGGFNAEARYQGLRNPFAGYAHALNALRKRLTDNQWTEFSSLLGAGIEGTIGAIHARFDSAEPLGAGMAKLQQTFFRLSGLTYWTDSLKSGAALMTSHHLALHSHLNFQSLPHKIQRLLNQYGISPTEWDLLRTHSTTGPDGRSYLLPADLLDNPTLSHPAIKLQALISDRTDFAVLSAGPREYFSLLNALNGVENDAWGQAVRFLTQFKTFSVATVTKTLSRDFSGSSSSSEAAISISTFLAQTIVLGYLSMTIKDLIRGKEPRDPTDPKTLLAAFMQAGGLGIYGDFLFSLSRENRMGRGFLETLGGPTVSSLADISDILKHSFNYATGSRENLPAAQALRLTMQNTPFLNLFYSRAALDYLILHNLQELASPGYLKRLEKRLQDDENRNYWLPPTHSLQPLGSP